MAGLTFDIVIAGKGLTGRIAALVLSKLGFTVALVEKTFSCHEVSRLYAISPANWFWLHTLGLVDEKTPVTRTKTMTIVSLSGQRLHLSAAMVKRPALAYFVNESVLWKKTEQWLSESTVTLLPDEAIVNVRHQEEDMVLFLEDKHLHGKLLVIADGVFSKLRGLVGIEADIHDYSENGIVAEFLPERSHQNEAWQWFGRQEILACLPKDDGSISIVWSLKRNLALQYANPLELTAKLEERTHHRFGKLALISPIAQYPLYKVHPASWIANRSLLLGDAAHAVHPLAGYGLNLTLGDLKILQQTFSRHVDPGHTHFLVDVAKKRRLFDQSAAILIDGLHRYFTKKSLLSEGLFAVAQHYPILKKALLALALEDYF